MSKNLTRRGFLTAVSAAGFGGKLVAGPGSPAVFTRSSTDHRPALLGGTPVRTDPFPSWPVIGANDRKTWSVVLESKEWNRGRYVEEFEASWARMLGARYVLATASGTSALTTALNALGIGPGDEVIVPPYTFVATVNVILLQHALPIFVDTDRETFQIDARKIEQAVTRRTRCLLPVHLGGSVADMDTLLRIARKRQIPVVEDACQSHLAEWREKKVGSLGDLGCFSFQASKNLNSGEGGSVAGSDPALMAACRSFHNQGRQYTVNSEQQIVPASGASFRYARNGDNRRMTEFQGALLLEQLTRLDEQSRTREQNAQHLTAQLQDVPGIRPARLYKGCTRNAYHLYMFRYDQEAFEGLPRRRFLEALRAEGIPCSGGYGPLNKEPFIRQYVQSRVYQALYSAKELAQWEERNHCPENDHLCQEAVWFSQTLLLGPKNDMDQIAEAIRKIQKHASRLA